MIANIKSWKTSTLGAGALIPTVAGVLKDLTDGDVLTNPDWNIALPLICTGLIGLFSKDGDKSSKELKID